MTLEELGVSLSEDDLLHLMHIADMNGDGKIDYRGASPICLSVIIPVIDPRMLFCFIFADDQMP